MKYSVVEGGETWDRAFEEALLSLNRVVLAGGEKIEGNACYWDLELTDEAQRPDARIVKRRTTLATAAANAGSVLEIGINAGHAALIMLAANPALKYFGVDIGHHTYTLPAINHLRDKTGRVEAMIGDSARALPVMRVEERGPFDLIHVDGAHDLPSAVTDLLNARALLSQDGVVIVDDMHLPGPKKAAEAMVGGQWFTGSIGEQVALLRLP